MGAETGHDGHDHAGHDHGGRAGSHAAHGSGGGGHGHAHAAAGEGALGAAALLTGGFLVAEVVGGLWSGSLALLADAGHMATDVGSLLLAWLALRLGRRPATGRRTYGLGRAGVLAAFVNGLALFLVAGWIVWEAWHRLSEPPGAVLGGVMGAVAVGGLVVNLVAWRILAAGEGHGLNRRAAILHVLGDLLGSVAAIVAAGVILATGWTPIDPILSVLVALLVLRSAWGVVAESGHILLEGAPPGWDGAAVAADLGAIPGVVAVRHVHAWAISEERPMVTLEAQAAEGADPGALRRAIKARLESRWGVAHATVEVDEAAPGGCR